MLNALFIFEIVKKQLYLGFHYVIHVVVGVLHTLVYHMTSLLFSE